MCNTISKNKDKICHCVWFRCYLNGREVFASKRLLNLIRKMHHILSDYVGHSESDFTFELRRIEYTSDGAVVINYLITDNVGDLI